MRFLTILVPVIAAVTCDVANFPPIFSSAYAKIRYQPSPPTTVIEAGELPELPMKSEIAAVSWQKGSEEVTERLQYNTTESPSSNEFSFEPESEKINFAPDNSRLNKEKLTDATELADLNERGVYYIYHPTGSFQKVVYTTEEAAMAADVKLEEAGSVERQYVLPIREPVVTYDPRTFVFQRLIHV